LKKLRHLEKITPSWKNYAILERWRHPEKWEKKQMREFGKMIKIREMNARQIAKATYMTLRPLETAFWTW